MQIHPRHMPHIQIHRLRAAFGRGLARNGPRHHIARRQLQQRMIALHESLTARVAQICALAAQRFAHQEARCAVESQRCGMELIKLHIGQLGPSLGCQRNAVACRYRRIGRLAIHLPRAARGHQHRARGHRALLAIAPQQPGAAHAPVRRAKLGHRGPLGKLDALMRTRKLNQ